MLALVSLAFSLGVPLFISSVSALQSSPTLTPVVVQALANDTLPRLCAPVNGLANAVSIPSGSKRGVPSPWVNFEGLNVFDAFPNPNNQTEASDDSAVAGPFHYMQVVNHGLAIYDKLGNPLCSPIFVSGIWDGFQGPGGGDICASTSHLSDAVALYDRQADRWLIARPSGAIQCLALSATPDPTGAYYRYAFKFTDENGMFLDYDKFGIGPDAYYSTSDPGRIFSRQGVFAAAFERDQMLSNQSTARAVIFLVPGSQDYTLHMQPAYVEGLTPPPAGSGHPFVSFRNPNDPNTVLADRLQVWQFQVNWTNPTSSTFAPFTTLSPASFTSKSCFGVDCVPQPGTMNTLTSLGEYLMYRLVYRNFAGKHETLLWNQTVDASQTAGGASQSSSFHAGIMWFELRRRGGAWTIYQQGLHAPDADHRFAGSIAIDAAGNIALGYNVSNGTELFPSIRYTGRSATDKLNTLRPEVSLFEGSGSQTGYPFWADYSEMAIDPTDDCTFWYTN